MINILEKIILFNSQILYIYLLVWLLKLKNYYSTKEFFFIDQNTLAAMATIIDKRIKISNW